VRAAAIVVCAAAASASVYAQSEKCAPCHSGIYESFRRTGMGRSFYGAEKIGAASYYHEPSD
jgi:cbb3-type cytochrome oxidase cytochrome c subunit